eukprot:gnl/MRDRNA2_/MRDRNA2_136504_c0_seq1.p1 gnl/MRDRNA2_/MRDRNA2_136504_c0~~gnl/MRDRNA2_/MRDRNA2_136504_c0_seq1.p1  ORF type:complete len:480 (+),score=61.95 gnl/MRDRNA2_/MRDRNA2_136504_c0_seq1:52-1491(+)
MMVNQEPSMQQRVLQIGVKQKSRKVAVVGAGSAGLVACRFLRDYGHRPVVFEAASKVGGIWAPDPLNKVVYGNLRTNLPKNVMQSFDLDFPTELPSYIEASDLGDYLEKLADFFDLRSFLRLNSKVIKIRALCSTQQEMHGQASWEVCWEHSGGTAKDIFDAVLVANGHYEFPYQPLIPGQNSWLEGAACGARTVSHSVTYNEPSSYVNRVVLVVGGRSSGVDIALALRRTAHFVYVQDRKCTQVTSVGSCMHIPAGAELLADGHIAYKGTVLEGPPVDDLILATGYQYRFPFLDAQEIGIDFGPDQRYVSPLYMHVVHSKRPSLCFMGVPLHVPAPIPLFEAEARFIAARWCYDGTHEEDISLMEAWVAARKASVGERSQDIHVVDAHCNPWQHMRDLTCLSGMDKSAYASYCERLHVVESIYKDRVQRRPKLPWDDDCYRDCEYSVDWPTKTWTVQTLSQGHPAKKLRSSDLQYPKL